MSCGEDITVSAPSRVKGFASRGLLSYMRNVFYVYVLHSVKDNGLYIGYSTDLRKRLTAHGSGDAFATSYRGPWKLIYYEAYIQEADALGREKYLKSGSGKKIPEKAVKALFFETRIAINRVGGSLYVGDASVGKRDRYSQRARVART
jgi:putative endonuclease